MTKYIVIAGKPQGKARHRTTRTGHTYTPKETTKYEERVKQSYLDEYGSELTEGAVGMTIRAFYPIPSSWNKAKKRLAENRDIYPLVKPDADNVAKIISDGLSGAAYADDKQIVVQTVYKLYGTIPRVEVDIWEVK